MGSNRPPWGPDMTVGECADRWTARTLPKQTHQQFLDHSSLSSTDDIPGRQWLVGSDTEEDGGSTPPAPTTTFLTSANAKATESLAPQGDASSSHYGKRALYCSQTTRGA
jgi:hypothetical protein